MAETVEKDIIWLDIPIQKLAKIDFCCENNEDVSLGVGFRKGIITSRRERE